ncbi:hypothetical protein AFK62_14075 [Cronobacter condimenti 1330]|uniref:Uncharacterized protein n=1 Tax=Cronobacter condimenti 1330 TaxID=1073999 RepID=A0ABM5VEF3_9ENTR|nr:hypothetical protein AFK62_14075 [Cronobacter condimenti 1330]
MAMLLEVVKQQHTLVDGSLLNRPSGEELSGFQEILFTRNKIHFIKCAGTQPIQHHINMLQMLTGLSTFHLECMRFVVIITIMIKN